MARPTARPTAAESLPCAVEMLPIETPRLSLVPGTVRLHEAELASHEALTSRIGADVPDDWPPADGEYDRDAIAFFIRALTDGGAKVAGWLSFFVLARPATGATPALVANAGYF